MKINVRNTHVVLRMNATTVAALKEYMHTKDGNPISFPYGVFVAKRGMGWYRLLTTTDKRQAEKLEFAIKVINRFLKEEEKVDQELKKWAPLMIDSTLQVSSFSNAHSAGEFGYLGTPVVKQVEAAKPAPLHALQQLAAKFNFKGK